MNHSILMGRLTRDPEIRYSQGENSIAVANFRLAVDRTYRTRDDEETADYFSCTAFGRLAEFAEDHLAQGIKVIVAGRLQNDNYKNRDGNRVYGMKLILSQIEFGESKKINEGYRDGNYRDDDEDDRESGRRSSSGERRSGHSSGQNAEQRRSGNRKSGSSREEGRRSSPRSDSGRRSRGRDDRDPDDEFMDTESADNYAFN